MTTNSSGLDLIKNFEGLKLAAYQDSVGVWTIGYGHTSKVTPEMRLTTDEAEALLLKDLKIFEAGVSAMVKVKLTPNQFSALVSFAYNLGLHSLASSTLLKELNLSHYMNASDEFLKWDHAAGKVMPGLTRRRVAERVLFLS